MEPLTIPYHLAIPAALSMIAIILIVVVKLRPTTTNKRFWISLIVYLSIYTIIISLALYDDLYAQWNLNNFDLNKDGVFAGTEITPEQKQAEQMLINDVGRNFSVVTAVFPAAMFAGVTYLIMFMFSRVKRNHLPSS